MSIKAPWLKHYGEVPHHIEYPDMTLEELVEKTAREYPNYTACEFMGKATTYSELLEGIHSCARSFYTLGIRPGDKVTICMPNTPQALICFYGLNVIGAVANMIHPLSGEGEIAFYLNDSESVAAVTLDQFVGKFRAIRDRAELRHLIVASVGDALGPVKKLGYAVTQGRGIPKYESGGNLVTWKDFLKIGRHYKWEYRCKRTADDPAVILYSGGTTGTTKGIILSNRNFNALALQTAAMGNCIQPGNQMLAAMPIFHGFGLGVCIHTVLVAGCNCVLVPKFNVKEYATLIKTKKPNYIAGVPTLYEALLRSDVMNGADLSCLKGVFSGGDSLSTELKKKIDAFLSEHGSSVRVREGYGTTECVTASCLTPYNIEREGSIGLPFPDMYYKIVRVNTTEELPYGEEGEICLTGPTLMLGYNNNPEETREVLREHDDGRVWLHTGDLGTMDADGFLYFRQRIKRMIVSSGYSIYPSQLENVIDAHAKVQLSCVIGVPDEYRMQKVKAFVVLKPGIEPTEEIRRELIEHCRKNMAKYAIPYAIEFRKDLPKTLVGKVAYRELEKETLGQ